MSPDKKSSNMENTNAWRSKGNKKRDPVIPEDMVEVYLPPPLLSSSIPHSETTAKEETPSKTAALTKKKPSGGILSTASSLLLGWGIKKEIDKSTDNNYEIMRRDEAGSVHSQGWTLEADRQLCILWFFTTHSIGTLASLLNYSAKMDKQVTNAMVQERLTTLANKSCDRFHIFNETKSLKRPQCDWTEPIRKMDYEFIGAWKAMQVALEQDARRGEFGDDDMTDGQLWQMGRKRIWSKKQRDNLVGKQFMGLQRIRSDERPAKIYDGYESADAMKRS